MDKAPHLNVSGFPHTQQLKRDPKKTRSKKTTTKQTSYRQVVAEISRARAAFNLAWLHQDSGDAILLEFLAFHQLERLERRTFLHQCLGVRRH